MKSKIIARLGLERSSCGWSTVGCLALAICLTQSPVLLFGQTSRLLANGNDGTKEVNAEWVESSSPVIGGGAVTTTYFPQSGSSLTSLQEPGINGELAMIGSQRPQLAGVSPIGSAMGNQPGANYAPIPTGNGGFLVPTVTYVPMNGSTLANYQQNLQQVNYQGAVPGCVNCQSNGLTQPTQYQQIPYQPMAAAQTPMLPATNGGIYGPISPNAQLNPAVPGFYGVQNAGVNGAAPANSGYRSLVPRTLPAGTYIGQGWLGQPKAYVSTQPVRNFFRYLIVP